MSHLAGGVNMTRMQGHPPSTPSPTASATHTAPTASTPRVRDIVDLLLDLVDTVLAVQARRVRACALNVAQGTGGTLLLHQLYNNGFHRFGRLK